MIKAVVFDYNGVLAVNRVDRFADIIAKEFNVDAKGVAELYRKNDISWQVEEISSEEFWGAFIKEFNLNTTIEHLREILESCDIIKPEVWDILRKLKEKHKTGLLSNNSLEIADFIRRNRDISLFDVVVFSGDIKIAKPDKGIFEEMLKKLKLNPEECVFTDDVKRYINAAKKLGWKGIWFKDAEQLKKELRKLGVKI